jgi:hypothetical protein
MLKRLIRPRNRQVRILVGVLLAALFCIQCTSSVTVPSPGSPAVALASTAPAEGVNAQLVELAKTDHAKLLELCRRNYDRQVRDYTCTLIKQERINGKVGEVQHANVKFLDEPFSVALHFVKNVPIGERVLYVQGRYDNQMLVKPKGWLGNVFGTVQREPDGPQARQNSLQPISNFGFANSIDRLLEVYQAADERGHLTEEFGGYAEVEGRKTIVLVRKLPAKNDYPAARTLTYVDTERLVPVMVEGFDWDDEFICRYVYKDVAFNVGLQSSDFTPKANEMTEPK